MSYVTQKIEADEKIKKEIEADRKKKALFKAYEQIDRIFGKPLSVFSVAKVVSFYNDIEKGEVIFSIDTFVFKYKYAVEYAGGFFLSSIPEKNILYVKSNKWYRGWYNLHYSAKRFKELVDKGKI